MPVGPERQGGWHTERLNGHGENGAVEVKTTLDGLPVKLPDHLQEILSACPGYTVGRCEADLAELAVRDSRDGWHEVAYDVPGIGRVVEARVCKVRNGIAANYTESYMRRRDPECMVIADDLPTDKSTYEEEFGSDFAELRERTFEWLKTQELAVFLFNAGGPAAGMPVMAVAPANAGFFAFGLSLLQGIVDPLQLSEDFVPGSIIYVAPPFRHSDFDGRQIVVHNRLPDMHELFSYNLYPGPSAKKGVYGVLISLGEKEEWVTAHCATVQLVTPDGREVTLMHEGASGGGKSEMLEQIHRQSDGRLLLARNVLDAEKREHLTLPHGTELRPVTDDMAMCHPSLPQENGRLSLKDAEQAWFVRVNHITEYGTDPHLEKITVHPREPLLFLNIDAVPGGTALIWEHIKDAPGVPCPNPRVILPRRAMPGVIDGPVKVDIRSFGVRTPACTREHPTFGIIGLLHALPPALAWLWRLAAPRGHDNPSIVDTEGMTSEGVGSYEPFTTGRRVDQANLLLAQFVRTSSVQHILCPNQHIGAWRAGFMPEWIAREYMASRERVRFDLDELVPARCSLLGYALRSMDLNGQQIPTHFLQVEQQPEVGLEAYDVGAERLTRFFHKQIKKYLKPDLDDLGWQIIEACLAGAGADDYNEMLAGAARPAAH